MFKRRWFTWRDPRSEMPDADDMHFTKLLVCAKGTDRPQEPMMARWEGGDEWEYLHSSPAFTTDSVAYWAYIPEPPNAD